MREKPERTWRVWVCPDCDEIVMRAGINGRCGGSLTEGTAHEDVAMRAAVVRECRAPSREDGP